MQFLAPFTHMPGPAFLLFYAVDFAVFLGICLLMRNQSDKSSIAESLTPEMDPDPYRIAYLRGGVNEVLRLASFELYSQGAIAAQHEEKRGSKRIASKWKLVPDQFHPESVSPFASHAAEHYSVARKPTEIFQSNVGQFLSKHFRDWDDWIDRENLKTRLDQRYKLVGIAFALAATYFSLGLTKILFALSNERYNIGFALAMMIAGSILLLLTALPRKLNYRGRDYLSKIRIIHGQHRSLAGLSTAPKDEASQLATHSGALCSLPVMAMGLFGVSALQASPFDSFRQTYQRSQSTASGCGSGCGSSCGAAAAMGCGASTGSSCGGSAGCGGGGGGGCGGGGCGGCGS